MPVCLSLPDRWRTLVRGVVLSLPIIAGGAGVVLVPRAPAAEPAPMPRSTAEAPAAAVKAAVALDQEIMSTISGKSELMANLQYLSDVIGPRLTGSRQLQRANKWTAEKMEAYGLENVHLEPWEIPVGWERGYARMKVLEPDTGRTIAVESSGWTPGTKGRITGPVVAIQARTRADLDQYKGKLKNAVVLMRPPSELAPITDLSYIGMRPNTPLDTSAGPSRPSFPGKTETKKDDAKPEKAKKDQPPAKKADDQPPAKKSGRPGGFGAGFIPDMSDFLQAEGVAAILFQSSKPHGLIAVSGSWRGVDRGAPQEGIARLVCAVEHYGMLWRLATDPNQKPVVELEVKNTFIPGPIVCFNTVGEIRGSEKPDEFVVIGAHLDSWDLGSGSTDNGTGSCVILECARVLGEMAKKGIRPKRTIRFVLYTGEEQGLHGSQEYVKRHKDELPKISVSLVHDTGTGKVKGFALMGRDAVRGVLAPELESLASVGFEGLSLRSSGGSDHASFDRAGVPGFACIQEPDEYRLTHHTQTDTFDKAKEPNLIQGAQVMAVTAMRVANLPDLLPRTRPAAGGGRRGGEEPKKEEKKDEKKGG